MTSSEEIATAAAMILRGHLVAFPTETVYGLGADATQDQAVAKIFAIKGRPHFNPLIAHVADEDAAFALGEFDSDARKLAKRFWPGPLTLVVPRQPNCPVSLLASAGLSSLALRVPAHPIALQLLRAVGRPVVAPSANPSGRISPTNAEHVRLTLNVEMILDGGPCSVGLESTVVSFLDRPTLLRPGGLPREVIEAALGYALSDPGPGTALHSPGQLESHYAPSAPMRLNASHADAGEIHLAFGQSDSHYNLSARGDLTEAAANLFRLMREIDALNPLRIAVSPVPSSGLGEAINDRLKRAAAPRGMPETNA